MRIKSSGQPAPAARTGRKGPVSAGLLRVAPLMDMPVLLKSAGVDPHGLLAEFGLSPHFFEDPENVLPVATIGGILKRCVERTNCAHFGLLVGRRRSLSVLGTIGYLSRSSPDVRSALQALSANLHLHDGGAVVSVSVQGRFAFVGYALLVDAVECSEQILDAAMAIACNIMRELCGQHWRLSGVQFAYARPANVRPHREFFGVMPGFDAEQSALIFPAALLDLPLQSSDPILHGLMTERTKELQERGGNDLVDQVRRILRPLVTASDCTLAFVAKRMNMHGRTLNRRLAAYGTTFREIRDAVRFETACQMLENTGNSAYQIANMLGYSDATAFSRAFRRWSGETPTQWRASRQGASPKPLRQRAAR